MILAHAGHHESIASAWEAPVAGSPGPRSRSRCSDRRSSGSGAGAAGPRGLGPARLSLAVALGTLALVSPLDYVGEEYLLSAHMLQHVVIGDLAVALAIVAIRGPLTFFLIPAAVLGRLARLAGLRAFLAFLLRPKVAFVLWALVIAAWHVPAAYDYTLTHQAVHDIEHLSFVLAGVLVWAQLVDPARRRELTTVGRLALAIALFAAGQVLADVLIFAQRRSTAPTRSSQTGSSASPRSPTSASRAW